MKAQIQLDWDAATVALSRYDIYINGAVYPIDPNVNSYLFEEYENTPVNIQLFAFDLANRQSEPATLDFVVPPYIDPPPPPAPSNLNWTIVGWVP